MALACGVHIQLKSGEVCDRVGWMFVAPQANGRNKHTNVLWGSRVVFGCVTFVFSILEPQTVTGPEHLHPQTSRWFQKIVCFVHLLHFRGSYQQYNTSWS